MQLVGAIAGAVLLRTAADRVFEGELSVGGLVALQLFLAAALAPIPQMGSVLQRYQAARVSFGTLREPFAGPIHPRQQAGMRTCESAEGAIVLDAVDFTYPGTTRRVLHDVTLEIPAGSSVAVAGPTGAGKSSIIKLIGRV